MKNLIFGCLLFFAIKSSAQVSLPCEPHSNSFHLKYKNKESYMPKDGDTLALSVHKTIKINIVVFNPIVDPPPAADHTFDSTGVAINFHSTDTAKIMAIIRKANEYLANNPAASDSITVLGRSANIHDTRFRLEVENITFRNASDMDWQGDFGITPLLSQYVDPYKTLNIFLTYTKTGKVLGGIAKGVSNTPHLLADYTPVNDDDVTSGNVSGAPFVVMRNLYKNEGLRNNPTVCANALLHEIGHTLGLHHVYGQDFGTPRDDIEFGNTTGQETFYDYLEDVFNKTGATFAKYFPRPTNNGTCTDSFGYKASSYDACTNNCMGGNPYGNYRSPMQLGRMHRNVHLLNIRNFVYNTYPADENMADPYYGQGQKFPLEITGNDTIDCYIKMYNDIRIKKNATLTVTCKMDMPYYSNIIVEPGGHLIVDGGIITSTADRGWRGIMVLGDASRSQDTVGNQGTVVTKNGAIIENAKDGIVVGDDRTNDFSKGGGIIQVSNTTFHNCARSIAFHTYRNFATWPAYREVNNRSYIRASQFLVDNNIPRDPQTQISLWEVRGVGILGCNFENTMDSATRLTKSSGAGNAITSDGANYTVSDYCSTAVIGIPCTPSTIIASKITGFVHGIHAYDAVRPLAYTVTNTLFEKNIYGIYNLAVNAADIRNDSFTISPTPDFAYAYYPTGIYSYCSNGYTISGNKFGPNNWSVSYPSMLYPTKPAYTFPYKTTGVYIDEGGSDNNTIEGNSYSFLEMMNYSNGCNTNGDVSPDDRKMGLQFLCNDYGIGWYNQFVFGDNAASDGIKCIQGTPSLPAANKFVSDPNILGIDGYTNHFGYVDASIGTVIWPVKNYYYSLPAIATDYPSQYTHANFTPAGIMNYDNCYTTSEGGTYLTAPKGGMTSTTSFGTLRSALDDTTVDRTTLLHAAYAGMNSPYADIDRTLLYFENGNIQAGNALYNAILSTYTYMTAKETSEFILGRKLMNVYANHFQNHLSFDTLSSGDMDSLIYVRDNGQMWARARACNWLYRITGDECPMHMIYMPSDPILGYQRVTQSEEKWCHINPNPSNGNFNIEYALPQKGNAELKVSDLSGRIIFTTTLFGTNHSSTIPAQNWPVSMYIYTISQSGQTIHHGKLVKK